MQETAHAVAFVEGFQSAPADSYQNDAWWRAIAKAETMFADAPPENIKMLNKKGKEYLTHTKSGYRAVLSNRAQAAGRRWYRVGMREKYKFALAACLRAEAEYSGKEYVERDDAGGPYTVDLDAVVKGKPNPGFGCSCEAYKQAKVCFHYVGLAMWLSRPYRIQPNGVLVFTEGEQE